MLTPQKKRKINPLLMNVILISGGIHVVAILILGGITVVKYVIPDDAQFEEPPAVEEVEPPKEVKVEIMPQRPTQQPMSNLRMRPVANIAVANVDVNLPTMDQSFTVSAGLGGFGGGSLLGGARGSIGMGMSDISVFGLKTRAERVLFVIDTERYMVMDAKGGLHSYRVIKDEIASMVGNLSAGTLFNVMLIDEYNMKLFKPQLVPAGAEVTQQLNQWLAPVNSSLDNLGVGSGGQRPMVRTKVPKYEEVYEGMHSLPTMAAKSQFALEMNVDAVFFIVGKHEGFQPIRTSPTEKQVAENRARREAMLKDPKIVAAIEAHEAEQPEMKKRVKAAHDKLNQQRAKKGLPPKVLPKLLRKQAEELGLKWKNPFVHLPSDGHQWLDPRTARNYFHELNQILFEDKGGKAPSMNVVLFLAGDEEYSEDKESAIQDFVRYFNGQLKIIRGLNEITKAASAADSKN